MLRATLQSFDYGHNHKLLAETGRPFGFGMVHIHRTEVGAKMPNQPHVKSERFMALSEKKNASWQAPALRVWTSIEHVPDKYRAAAEELASLVKK